MEITEVNDILAKHAAWLSGLPGGKRADFHAADLWGVGLNNMDIRFANFRNADLRCASLWKADLRGANLYGADIHEIDLQDANLQGANLDFSCLPLSCGGLYWTIDRKLLSQFLYHVCSMRVVGEPEWASLRKALLPLANEMHRSELPRLKEEE